MSDPGAAWHPSAEPGPVARLGANVVAAASVLVGRAMIGLGLRRPPEGWRRTVGILLRSESTRFALSAFGLRVPGQQDSIEPGTAQALLSFFAHEPDAHFSLEWRRPVTLRRRLAFVDVVLLQFAPDDTLEAVDPWLVGQRPLRAAC